MLNMRGITEQQLKDWLTRIGYNPKELVNELVDYAFEIRRGNVNLAIARQTGKDYIIVDVLVNLSSELEPLYTDEIDRQFKKEVAQRIASIKTDIGFSEGSTTRIFDRVFDNGFSYNLLYRSIRNVAYTAVSLTKLLRTLVNSDAPSNSELQPDLDYYL